MITLGGVPLHRHKGGGIVVKSHGLARTFEFLGEESGVSGDEEFELLIQITGGQVNIPGANPYIKNRDKRETETGLLERIKHAEVNYSRSKFTFPQTEQPSHAETPNIGPGVSQTEQKNGCDTLHAPFIKVEDLAMGYSHTEAQIFPSTNVSFYFRPDLQCCCEEIPKIPHVYFSPVQTDISNFQQMFGSCIGKRVPALCLLIFTCTLRDSFTEVVNTKRRMN